jgi:hypothetical protein
VLVLTSTVSADGSISGMYRASVKLAEQTYAQGANRAVKGANIPGDFKQIADGISAAFMNREENKDASGNGAEQKKDGAAVQTPEQQPQEKR